MQNLTSLKDGFLAEAEEDNVGLWQLIKAIKEQLNVRDSAEIRRLTIDLVRRLMASGMRAGDPPYLPGGFKVWPNQNVDDVVKRIQDEWDALGREPNIADIAWFSLGTRRQKS